MGDGSVKLKRGSVAWIEFPPPIGRRPAVLLLIHRAGGSYRRVVAAPVSTHIRYADDEVMLSPEAGVRTVCAVKASELYTLPIDRVGSVTGQLATETMGEILAKLRAWFAQDFDGLI